MRGVAAAYRRPDATPSAALLTDRTNGVDLLDQNRIDMAAFVPRSDPSWINQFEISLMHVMFAPSEMGSSTSGNVASAATGKHNRALKITTLSMLDGGVRAAAAMRWD
jgi:hypothetical protein